MDDCDGRFCYDENCGGKMRDNYKTSDEVFCLQCHHPAGFHAEMQDRISRLFYWIMRKKGCTVGNWCKCDRLVPSDNLRYLEELNDLRG